MKYVGETVERQAEPTLVVRRRVAVEIGFAFERPLAGEGDVVASEIPAGRAVQCIHVGPFDQLGAAYGALEAWMAERGLEHGGPAFEVYLDDP
ncbi:MAG: GyrI-like domain-containing protein [Trueperaceae bacterium]